jgi:hypothetical protein
MSDYHAPTQDMQFVINEIAGLDEITSLAGFEDATADLVEAVLEQAGVLANEVFSPLNHPGDEHGTRIEDGVVVSPPGYAEAYSQFSKAAGRVLANQPQSTGRACLSWCIPRSRKCGTRRIWHSRCVPC